MADASFAARPQQTAPVSRTERTSARPSSASSAQTADFNRNLSAERSESVSAAVRLAGAAQRAPQPGGGLLGTGVQFLLAQTRTQEAGAPLPPISNLTRARDQYLSAQAQVRDTIAANTVLREGGGTPPAPTEQAPTEPVSPAPASGYGDDDGIDDEPTGRPSFAAGGLI